MKVREILQVKGSQVYSIGPDQTVLDAVAMLMEHRIGALLVRDGGGGVVGVISERDVLRECLHRSTALGDIAVRDAMTSDLVVCLLDDDIAYAMGMVTKNRVRHLPVMDGDQVAGMISIGDLVKASLDEVQYENRYLRDYITSR
jgi:CBS domain-containing protein